MEQASSTLVVRVSKCTAFVGSLGFSLIFVASLYLWKLLGYADQNRDAKGTIQRRFVSALLSCGCSAALVRALAEEVSDGDGLTFAALLGFTSDAGWPTVRCLLLTAVLFLGPLVQHLLAVKEGVSPFVNLFHGSPWVAARNLIVAPCTEEFVFRACLVRLWVGAALPMWSTIFLSPFCFALAHTHHFVEQVRRCDNNKRNALMNISFQVFYTSLFGMYSNFLLLRTGSTTALMLTHSFCNHQGFPDVGFVAEKHPLHKHKLWLGMLYGLGIFGFAKLAGPLTAGFDSSFKMA